MNKCTKWQICIIKTEGGDVQTIFVENKKKNKNNDSKQT